jgi:hypothetical protein
MLSTQKSRHRPLSELYCDRWSEFVFNKEYGVIGNNFHGLTHYGHDVSGGRCQECSADMQNSLNYLIAYELINRDEEGKDTININVPSSSKVLPHNELRSVLRHATYLLHLDFGEEVTFEITEEEDMGYDYDKECHATVCLTIGSQSYTKKIDVTTVTGNFYITEQTSLVVIYPIICTSDGVPPHDNFSAYHDDFVKKKIKLRYVWTWFG